MKTIIWSGAALDPSGYGEATRNYVCGLADDLDWRVKLRPSYFWRGKMPELPVQMETLKRLQANDFDPKEPHLYLQHLTPENYMLGPGQCLYHIGMTTFETNGIPAAWQGSMRSQDEIFTFSNFNKQTFIDAGIRRPITVIPHGVDVAAFHPAVKPLDSVKEMAAGRFVFGSNFDWTARKNPYALLKAYFTTFTATDPVLLVLKVYYQHPIEQGVAYMKNAIDAVRRSLGLTNAPQVAILSGIVGADQMPSFYSSLDAYVLPSRGEGFGLTYAEAMATGLPTVAVGWSGHMDFMTDANSYLLHDYKLTDITPEDAGTQTHYAGQQWASCSVEELGHTMRSIFDNPTLAQRVGDKARMDMVTDWTWCQAVKKLRDRLDAIWSETSCKA